MTELKAPTTATLVYAFDAERLLLLQRRKPPNRGLWSPPGGKLKPGESPLSCALREFHEETGLRARRPALRAVLAERDVDAGHAWLVFIFRAEVQGDPSVGNPEGDAQWFNPEHIGDLAVPPADPEILRLVRRPEPGTFFLTVRMQADRLLSLEVEGPV
jgi:8-oxo-dGTP diphosphatase